MNLGCATESPVEIIESLANTGDPRVTYNALKENGFVRVPIKYRKYEEKGFATPTGKIELYSTIMEKLGYSPLPVYEELPESPISAPEIAKEYPLVLTTGGRIPVFFNSEGRQISKLRRLHPDPIVEIHPETAARFDISEGDWIWIETSRGRIRQKARFVNGMDPRVVSAQHGWWFPETKSSDHGVWLSNVNVLTKTDPPYDPAMGTYQLRALLCRVSRAKEAPVI
jgi:anaerobic selenocysteine-containing dehydrogenase